MSMQSRMATPNASAAVLCVPIGTRTAALVAYNNRAVSLSNMSHPSLSTRQSNQFRA